MIVMGIFNVKFVDLRDYIYERIAATTNILLYENHEIIHDINNIKFKFTYLEKFEVASIDEEYFEEMNVNEIEVSDGKTSFYEYKNVKIFKIGELMNEKYNCYHDVVMLLTIEQFNKFKDDVINYRT